MNRTTSSALIGLLLLVMPLRAGIRFLYEFSGTAIDGSSPNGVILSGTTLYGMTHGVTNTGSENGTIFKIETDGTGFTLLHTFVGGSADGRWPSGSLIISGTTLYGMTSHGGDADKGTIFKIGTDGTGFALLHEFKGGYDDGKGPQGDLLLSGSTLFGMTALGGDKDGYDSGTIFKISTDGRRFALLHRFTRHGEGCFPSGNLAASGTTLYGMTGGAIFRIETNGGGFAVLHEFTGGAADGARPFGGVLLIESTLYGMTMQGGVHDLGTIFKMEKDGSGFALLHGFAGGHYDGAAPYGSLINSGSTLYGMTSRGGDGYTGTIFEMQTDGTGFAVMHGFGRRDSASSPEGTPLLHDSTLYGVVSFGNIWWQSGRGEGVIFSLPLARCDLDLLVERHEVRAFVIQRHYADIHFSSSCSDLPVTKYRIMRRDGNGEFFLRKTILPEELQDGQFRMQDTFLDRGTPYTYRVEAYDDTGTLLGFSMEKSI